MRFTTTRMSKPNMSSSSNCSTPGATPWTCPVGISQTVSTSRSRPERLCQPAVMSLAQDPAAVQSKFGVSALGPWTGTLNNNREKIVLRNALGETEDEVEYQLGFPWPTVGDTPGYSIELVNPAFDNNLGGNWRASVVGNPLQQSRTLLPDHAAWKYFKGLS